MRVIISQPAGARPGRTGATKVQPATNIVLTVDGADAAVAGGQWMRLGAVLPPAQLGAAPSYPLTFTMDDAGSAAGTYLFVQGASASEGARIDLARGPTLGPVARALIGAVVVVGALLLIFWTGDTEVGVAMRAYAFATLAVLLPLVLLQYITQRVGDAGGILSLFIGDDRKTSTSKTQLMLWTILITFALAYISAWVLLTPSAGGFLCGPDVTNVPDGNCVVESAWDAYIILLGLPAASAVIAKGFTSYQVDKGMVQKPAAEVASPIDIATDDASKLDIVDVQYLIFNFIALCWVAVGFVQTGRLDEVPPILLGLTSTAAATYVLNKALQRNAPRIASVIPGTLASGGAGTRLRIVGFNLFPDGTAPLSVKIGGFDASGVAVDFANQELTAEQPGGLAVGSVDVVVVTGAHVETEVYKVAVA